jgi:protein TonB
MAHAHHIPAWRRLMPAMAALAVSVPLLGVATMLLMAKPDADKRHTIRQVTVLRLPPPPPPPKPEEKPPEPPKKEEIKLDTPRPIDEPKAAQDEPQAGLPKLDAEGSGPGDQFGMLGHKGGNSFVLGGSASGALALAAFGSGAARHIAQELARNPKLKSAVYRIEIKVWLSKDGRFERGELERGTGDRSLDALLLEGLTQVAPLRQPVPADLPQPLRIRVTSSDA